MIRSLLWKEWREHLWKMLTVSAMLLIASIIVRARSHTPRDDWNVMVMLGWALFVWLGAIWTAAFDISSDRAAGIERFLEALPSHRMKIFLIRTGVGLFGFLLPAIILYPWGAKVFTSEWAIVEPILATSVYIYCILLALVTGSRREGYIALVGVLVMLLVVIGGGLLVVQTPGLPHRQWSAVISPIVFLGDASGNLSAAILICQILLCLILWSIAAWRFQRLPSRRMGGVPVAKASLAGSAGSARLRKSFALPLFWKEWREQRGIVLGVGFFAIMVAIIAGSVEGHQRGLWNAEGGYDTFFNLLMFMGITTPTIVAIILGQSAFAEDLSRPIDGFWRTRPINPTTLFAVKLGTASGGILLLFLGLMAAGGAGQIALDAINHRRYQAPPPAEMWSLVGIQCLWLQFVLALSMLATVLFRRAMLSLFVTIIVLLGILSAYVMLS